LGSLNRISGRKDPQTGAVGKKIQQWRR